MTNYNPAKNVNENCDSYWKRRRLLKSIGYGLISCPFVALGLLALIISAEARFYFIFFVPIFVGAYLVIKND